MSNNDTVVPLPERDESLVDYDDRWGDPRDKGDPYRFLKIAGALALGIFITLVYVMLRG